MQYVWKTETRERGALPESSEAVLLIPFKFSSRRGKPSLAQPVVTVELFEVEEKKPEPLAAHVAGYDSHALPLLVLPRSKT